MVLHERFLLSNLDVSDKVKLTTGVEPDAFEFMFTVVALHGDFVQCDMVQTGPDGKVVGPARAVLQGAGRWTTEKQNPMQRADFFARRPRQDVAMSIGYGVLRVGDLAIISDPMERNGDRLYLEPKITMIETEPFQE